MATEEKAKRKRQKQLCKKIREQMEFYFSDANLQKDRFLRKQMDQTEDGWLNLSMFENFNRLKMLTTDMTLVAKALSTSELIQVSEDSLKIKRKFPVTSAKDVDDRTVYVEQLPAAADHTWVKKVFSEYGRVVYVSLPRYRSTRDLKGFGFVEFQTKQEAELACKMLNQADLEEDKVGRFPVKHNKQMQELQKRISLQKKGGRVRAVSETEAMEIIAGDRKAHSEAHSARKRRWSQGSNGPETEDSSSKRCKLAPDSSSSEDSDDSDDNNQQEEFQTSKKSDAEASAECRKQGKRKASDHSEEVESDKKVCKKENQPEILGDKTNPDEKKEKDMKEQSTGATKEADKSKRKKNRKKKKKVKEETKEMPGLKVISKREWLELRSEYLSLQKQSMKKLKQALKQISINPDKSSNTGNEESVEMADKENSVKKSKEPEFTPGVIVKIHSTEPLNRKQIKARIDKFGEVAYIDVLEGDTQAHVRFSSTQAASDLSTASIDEYTLTLLTGEAEKQYWEKLAADRARKLGSKTKNKKRGKDKAIQKAEATRMESSSPNKKHIIFDDD